MDTRRLMKAVFAELLEELNRNDALRERMAKIVEEHADTSVKAAVRPHRRSPGPLDPMQVYRESPGDLEPKLRQLSAEQLKDIIAEHGMDRTKLAMKWKSNERLIELIVQAVRTRAQKGDAFRGPPGGAVGLSPGQA